MCFLRGSEVVLDAKMNFGAPRPEPCAAASSEVGRLGMFLESENAAVEPSRLVFPPARHRKLDVVQSEDGHAVSLLCMCERRVIRAPVSHVLRWFSHAHAPFSPRPDLTLNPL